MMKLKKKIKMKVLIKIKLRDKICNFSIFNLYALAQERKKLYIVDDVIQNNKNLLFCDNLTFISFYWSKTIKRNATMTILMRTTPSVPIYKHTLPLIKE